MTIAVTTRWAGRRPLVARRTPTSPATKQRAKRCSTTTPSCSSSSARIPTTFPPSSRRQRALGRSAAHRLLGAGQFATDGPGDASVVVSALGGPGFEASPQRPAGRPTAARERCRGRGARSPARRRSPPRGPHAHDALAGDQEEVIRGAYSVLGATVPLVGGCAGDDFKMVGDLPVPRRRVLQGAVVAATLVSDAPFGVGVCHGWTKTGEPVMVTSRRCNTVYELDDRPALDVYLERLGAPEAAYVDPAAFAEFGIVHPLGLDRRSSEPAVRFVAGADFEERSLSMIAEVPQGGLAWFMSGDEASVHAATDEACGAALDGLDGREPLALIAFDCAARRGVLGDDGHRRGGRARIAAARRRRPVAGFYSYGEIARTTGAARLPQPDAWSSSRSVESPGRDSIPRSLHDVLDRPLVGSAADRVPRGRLVRARARHRDREAIERSAEALEAEVGAVVQDGELKASIGFPAGQAPAAELVEAATTDASEIDLPGLGRCAATVARLDGDAPGFLLLGRIGGEEFSREDVNLLRGMSRVLTLTLQMLRLLEDERALREESHRRASPTRSPDWPTAPCSSIGSSRRSSRPRAAARRVAVLFLDLDRFKLVNDSLGHAAGDAAARPSPSGSAARARSDTVARLGGDEFAILLEGVDGATSASRVARADRRRALASRSRSRPARCVRHRQHRHRVRHRRRRRRADDAAARRRHRHVPREGSGARAATSSSTPACTPRADARGSSSRAPSATRSSAASSSSTTSRSSTLADGRDRRRRGAGALAPSRARAARAGRVHPARRGDRADRPLGRWVLREACRQSGDVARRAGRQPRARERQRVAASSPARASSARRAACSSDRARRRAARLEITEGVFMTTPAARSRSCASCGARRPARIDDFGTGYSSLAPAAVPDRRSSRSTKPSSTARPRPTTRPIARRSSA